MKHFTHFKGLAAFSLVAAIGCGGGGAGGKDAIAPDKRSGLKGASGQAISKEAANEYQRALETFKSNDESFKWGSASCKSVAEAFVSASEQQVSDGGKPMPAALYNAGLAYMRCGMESEAIQQYMAASAADANFHRARAQMVLFEHQKNPNLDGTISQLEQLIREAKFQNVEALVAVAALQMERGDESANSDGANDFERAKKNIQRALAIDDNYMPASNQLAIYYLESARRQAGASKTNRRRGLVVAGSKKARVNQQQLDLAALVASQAIQKNPNYAPIHNTAGLIQVELKNFNGAVKSFDRARQLNPKFFEAHMNYAAVSLSFRGFEQAEQAYRETIKLEPKDYEAYLGLALAVRGQINVANFDAKVAETEKYLAKCKEIDGGRAEAYYNEAILVHEFKSKSSGEPKAVITSLRAASTKYDDFIQRAGSDEVFAEAVKRSQDRIQDINDTIKFIEDGIEAKKQQEELDRKMAEEEKARKAEEERLKKEEEAKLKAEAEAKKKEAEDKKKAEELKKKEEAEKKKAADDAKKPAPAAKKPAPPAKKK